VSTYIGEYTRVCSETYVGNYTGTYTRAFGTNSTQSFLGNYTGITVSTTSSVIDTYTLYVRKS
jgi:hypothetical protein